MKTQIVAAFLGFAFFFTSHTAYSAVNFDPSGSMVEDSSILPVGYSNYYMYVDLQHFGSAYGGQSDANMVSGFRVGIRERLEVGLTLPVRSNLAENSTGLTYIMATARFELASYKQGSSKLFLTVYRSGSEMQGAPAITTGNPNQGFYLSLFDSDGRFEKRYLFGMARADTRIYSGGVGSYEEYHRYMFSIGARFGQPYNRNIWLDFILHYDEKGTTQNYYGYIAPTFEFPKPSGRTLFIGAAFGLPIDKAAPHTQIVVGMHYRPSRSPHVYSEIPVPPASPDEPVETTTQQQGQVPTQTDQKVVTPPVSQPGSDMVTIDSGAKGGSQSQAVGTGSVAAEKPTAENACKATVEILYFSGQKQRALQLAESLKAQGYCVNNIIAQELSILESELYVRRDTGNEIVAEVMDISGARKQSIRQLPWGTDIRIILGKY